MKSSRLPVVLAIALAAAFVLSGAVVPAAWRPAPASSAPVQRSAPSPLPVEHPTPPSRVPAPRTAPHAPQTVGVASAVASPAAPSLHPPPPTVYYHWYFNETGFPGTLWYVYVFQGGTPCYASGSSYLSSSTSQIEFTSTSSNSGSWCLDSDFAGYTSNPGPDVSEAFATGGATYDITWTENPPAAPTGLSSTSTIDSAIALTWTNPTTGNTPTGNVVRQATYASGACGTYATIDTATSPITSYTATGLSGSGTAYCFQVEATDSGGAGAAATLANVSPHPLVLTISSSANPTDAGSSTTFTPTITFGTSPYTYAWTVGGTAEGTASTLAYTFPASGSYTVGLTVTDAASADVTASLTETVNAALVVSATSNASTADAGFGIAFSGSPTGGSGSYTYSWTLNGVVESTAASFTYAFATAGSYTMDLTVTDSLGFTDSASVSETINADPSVAASSSANPADVGYAVTFTATATGGTGTITYAWTVDGSSAGSGATLSYSFGSAGSYTVAVTITDGDHRTASNSVAETAVANPAVSLSISPNPTDVGVAVTLTASPSSGVSPYTYAWQVNGAAVSATTASWSDTFSSAGTYTIEVTVTDSDGHTASATGDATVNGDVSVSLSSSQNPTDYGNTVTFTAAASGGVTPYGYAWTVGGNPISTTCPASYTTCTFIMQGSNLPGALAIGVDVTDSVGSSYTTSLTETVNADPTVAITSSQNPTDVGNTVTFSAATTGGTGTFTYAWTVAGAAQSSTTSQMSYTFNSAGTFKVNVTATDSVGVATSYSFTETVNADPGVSMSPSRNPTDVGVAVTFTATETGGTGTITYVWTVNSVTQSSTTSTLGWTPSSTGIYPVEVTVTDAVGKTVSSTVQETINADPTVAITSSQNPTDVGNTVTFSAATTGGTGTFTYAWSVAGAAQSSTTSQMSYTFNSAGTFKINVTATDSVGVATSYSFTETVNADPTVAITSSQNPTDIGNTVTFSAATTGGTGTFTYAWTVAGAAQSSTTSQMSYTFGAAGTFAIKVTATDSVAVATSYSFTETVNADPSVSMSPSHNPTDVGVAVTFTATETGGTGTITYAWTVNSVTQSSTTSTLGWTPSSTGIYPVEVTVTDAVGKTVSSTVQETINADPTSSLSAQYNPVDQGIADLFTPTVTGGTGPFAYAWTVGGTSVGSASTLTYSFGSTGSFSVAVTVTDALGQTTSQTLTVTVQKDPAVTASGPAATDTGISTGWSGLVNYGASPYSYSWTINGGAVGTAASLSYTFSTAASYTLNLTVTDSQHVTGYWQETVIVSAQPSVSASASASAADVGISVTFTSTVTAGTAPFTYIWLADGTQVGTSATLTWSVTAVGANTVEVQITDASGAHATSASVTVTGNSPPSLTASAAHSTIDPGVSDTLTATVTAGTSPFAYAWSIAGGTGGTLTGSGSSVTFSSTSAGTFKVNVTVTDTDGNHAAAQVSITVNAAPTVAITSSQNPTDAGDSGTFSAATSGGVSPFAYAWSVAGAAQSSTTSQMSYTFSAAGTFKINVTATDSVGVATSYSFTETVNADPSVAASASASAADVGISVTFTSTVTAGTAPFTYIWLADGTQVGTSATLTWSVTAVGANTVEVQITDASGAHATSAGVTVTGNSPPSLTASAAHSTIDPGVSDTLTATVTAGTSPFTYAWSIASGTGGTLTGSGSSVTFSSTSAGTFKVNVTVTDTDGNHAATQVTIAVNAAPTVTETANRTSLSVGIPTAFTATVSGGVGPYAYAWTVGTTAIGTTDPIDYTFGTAGTYWVNVTATDSLGVAATAAVEYTVTNAPTASIVASQSATDVGRTLSFGGTAHGGTSPYNYTWYVAGVLSGYGSSFDHLFPATGTFVVGLTVRDASGLTSSTSVSIVVNPKPTATMSATYTSLDTSIPDTFTTAPSDGTTPYSYAWSIYPGGPQSATTRNATFSFGAPGNYMVNVTVTDAVGSTVQLSETVVVAANIAASITALYSSVDVGINDAFRPVVAGGVGPYSYSWLVGGVVHASEYLTLAFAAAGTDSVQLTVADSFGHDSTVSLAVTVLADPTVTPSLVNPPVVASLNAEYHAAAAGGYGVYTFTWTFPAGHQVSGAWANYTWDTAGPLAYQLYFADQGGFNETLSLSGYAHLFVSAIANATRGPAPLPVTFGVSVLGGSSYAFAWSFGNGQNAVSSSAQETFAAGNWTVRLVVTSANGAVGWSNLTIVSLPAPATVSVSPASGITVLTAITLTATPTWVASSPESAAWTLPNGTVLHGSSVTVTFATYGATKDVALAFTYGPNATVWSHTVVISMTPATPTAAATGVSTLIPPGTLLSVSGAPSTSPDAAISYYNWTLSGLLYHGEVQSFYFNSTGSFALSLTVTDALGATGTANWTIRVESAGSNATIAIGISSIASANSIAYKVSVSTPGGIAAADAFVDGQLLTLTLVNETLTGSVVTSANYTLSVDLGSYAAGTYTLKVIGWNLAGQSNTASTTFTVSLSASSGGGGFDIVAYVGGPGWFWSIVIGIVGIIAAVAGLTRRNTTDIDVDGVQLVGRPGKALVVKSVPKKGKGGRV